MIKKLFLALICLPLHVYCADATTTASTVGDEKSSVKEAAPEPWDKTLLQLVVEYMHKHQKHPALQNLSYLPFELKSALWTGSKKSAKQGMYIGDQDNLMIDGNNINYRYILRARTIEICSLQYNGPHLKLKTVDKKPHKGNRLLTSNSRTCAVSSLINTESLSLGIFGLEKSYHLEEVITFYDILNTCRGLPERKEKDNRISSISSCIAPLGIKAMALSPNGSKLLLQYNEYIRIIDLLSGKNCDISLEHCFKQRIAECDYQLTISDSGKFFAMLINYKKTGLSVEAGQVYLDEINPEGTGIIESSVLRMPAASKKSTRPGMPYQIMFAENGLLYYPTAGNTIEVYDPDAKTICSFSAL